MALADLVAELERAASAQETAVREAAEAAAASLHAESAERRMQRRATALATERRRLDAEHARARRAAQREAASSLLAALRRVLDRIFAAALERLGERGWIERSAVELDTRLEAALALAAEGELRVVTEPALVERLRALVTEPSRIVVEGRSGTGAGFTVEALRTGITIDDCWRGRLERMRPELELELVRELEADSR